MKFLKNLELDVLLFFIFFYYFYSYIFQNIHTDLKVHTHQILQINIGKAEYPPNFLYYFLVNLFSGFSNSLEALNKSASILLSLATTAKYFFTKLLFLEYFKIEIAEKKTSIFVAIIFSVLLMLFFGIPNYYSVVVSKYWYISRLVPNILHNSTSIFLFPFTILIFWFFIIKNWGDILNQKLKYISFGILLIVINLLIKPSFLFVFIPVTSIYFLWKHKFSKLFFIITIPFFVGFILVVFQYYLIYKLEIGNFATGDNELKLGNLFEVWKYFVPENKIIDSMILSFAFPLIYLILFWKKFIKNEIQVVSGLMLLLGVIIFAFLYEDGLRKYDANFIWQVILAYYVFLVQISLSVVKEFYLNTEKWKIYTCTFFFFLHVISGIAYLIHVYNVRTYI